MLQAGTGVEMEFTPRYWRGQGQVKREIRCSNAKEKLVTRRTMYGLAFGRIDDAGNWFGGSVRLAVGADADPIAGGAFEVDDIGAGIFALQSLVEAASIAFMMEDADLNAPSS